MPKRALLLLSLMTGLVVGAADATGLLDSAGWLGLALVMALGAAMRPRDFVHALALAYAAMGVSVALLESFGAAGGHGTGSLSKALWHGVRAPTWLFSGAALRMAFEGIRRMRWRPWRVPIAVAAGAVGLACGLSNMVGVSVAPIIAAAAVFAAFLGLVPGFVLGLGAAAGTWLAVDRLAPPSDIHRSGFDAALVTLVVCLALLTPAHLARRQLAEVLRQRLHASR